MSYQPPGGAPPPPQPPWQPQQPQPAGAPYPASAYAATGYGYTPAVPPRSLKGLATAVTVLLAVSALASIFGAVAFFHRASVVDDLANVNFQDIKDADSSVTGAVGLFGALLIATGVVWIIWQFRHAKNAETLRGNYGLTAGWAIGGWFIPLGNYVLPQLQLFQAAKASDPDLPSGQPPALGRAPAIVPVWWIINDLSWMLFSLGRSTRPGEGELNSFADLDKFTRADRVSGFAALLFVAAAVVAIFVVRTLTERQMRALASHVPQPPPWQQPAPPPQQWPPPAPPPPPPQQWPPPPPPPA